MTGVYKNSEASGDKPSAFGRLLDALVPSRRAYRNLQRDYGRMEAFSRAIPLEYCGWDQSEVQAISSGFAALLGTEKITTLEDIQAALIPGDAAALDSLYDRLQQYGENFEIILHTLLGKRTLKLIGKRGLIEQSRQVFSMLWVMDITDLATGTMRAADIVAKAEKREADLRASLNALPFPVWLRNSNLDIVWCNKHYAKMVDDTAAAVVAEQKKLPLTGVNRSDVNQQVLAQRAMAQLSPQMMRGHVIVDGQRRLIELTETPLPQEKRTIGFATDVTKEEDWTQAYERLSASHREGMEQLRTAIAMFDADTRLEFYNSAYEQLTGMSASFLDGKPRMVDIIEKMRELRRLPEQADFKQFKQQWQNRFTSLLEPYEEMQYMPDGSVVRLIVVPRPMGGLLLTQEDVTSRLQLETSYNTLMAVQQETLDNLAEGVAVFGEDGRLKLANQAYAEMWRLPLDDLSSAPHITRMLEKVEGLFHEPDWPRARNIILGNALEREVRRGRLIRADGAVLEYSVMPLPDGNALNAWFDVTDTVKVEEALLEKNAALEEAERLKMDFLANVSYQLRTPLNAIMGFTEMLHHQYFGPLNERQAEYTASMIEAGQRLVSLINDILDLSTIEAGYLKLYPAEVEMQGLIKQVVQLTQEWARKQKLEIVVECPDVIPILADERRIKQVLLNLISNGINYSPNGGTLTVSARRGVDDSGAEILDLRVSDTGLGIPAADVQRIFTPFEKIHDKKVHRRSGAGLGLSLVKNIIQMHGGTVTIESVEGEGTTVICRLPLHSTLTPATVEE